MAQQEKNQGQKKDQAAKKGDQKQSDKKSGGQSKK